jgi:hypothetical protein
MSLKDHSDTWVKATFTHTSNAHLQGPRESHSTQSVASKSTAAGKASVPQASRTKQSICSGWDCQELDLLRRESYYTTRQDLSYSGGRDPLSRRGTCRRESWSTLLLSIRRQWKAHSAGSSADALFICLLVLWWLVTPLDVTCGGGRSVAGHSRHHHILAWVLPYWAFLGCMLYQSCPYRWCPVLAAAV